MARKAAHILILLSGLALSSGCGDDGPTGTGGGNDIQQSGDVTILQGSITENRTLLASRKYLLRGAVFVEAGATLTIEAGTTIFGESSSTPPGTLIIAKGSKIMANGTKDAPIVLTSDREVGKRGRGQWGGLIINGAAPLNTGATAQGEGDTGEYGGDDPHDNSGILRYVRVEFAGQEFSPDNELNGIAFQGVGDGTTVEYVQVHFNQDDGIEFFGGTVNAKYVLCTGIRDDSFDWTDGWTGKGQFWVAQQRGDDADNGIEADNNSDNNDLTPRSSPTLYNVTLVGDPSGPESDTGMLLREGTAGRLANFIVTGFNLSGLDVDHGSTKKQIDRGTLTLTNSIFFGNRDADGNGNPIPGEAANFKLDDDGIDEAGWAGARSAKNEVTDPKLISPFSRTAPDFRPAGDSPAADGSLEVAIPPADGFFSPVDFSGGVDPDNDWTKGWTTSAQN